MNMQENEPKGAQTAASPEAKAADAAMETELVYNSEGDASEIGELVDYNEQEELEAAQKAADLVALKEMLTLNGHALKEVLRTEKVKAHYTSPLLLGRESNVY